MKVNKRGEKLDFKLCLHGRETLMGNDLEENCKFIQKSGRRILAGRSWRKGQVWKGNMFEHGQNLILVHCECFDAMWNMKFVEWKHFKRKFIRKKSFCNWLDPRAIILFSSVVERFVSNERNPGSKFESLSIEFLHIKLFHFLYSIIKSFGMEALT